MTQADPVAVRYGNSWKCTLVLRSAAVTELLGEPARWGYLPHDFFYADETKCGCDTCVGKSLLPASEFSA